MGGRGGITTETIENSVVALGGNLFETGLINVPAGDTIKKGTLLKRAGTKFAPASDADTPVAVNPFDIPNPGTAAADLSFRALISGPVRADLLTVGDAITTADQNDMLRNVGIIPVKINDLSRTE